MPPEATAAEWKTTPYLWQGLVLALLLPGLMLAWWAVFGLWHTLSDPAEPLGISFDGRNHLTMALIVAFVWPASRWVRDGAARDLTRLGEAAEVPPAELAELERRTRVAPARVRGCVLGLAFVIGVAIIPLTGSRGFTLEGWDMHHVWAVANNTAVFYGAATGAYLSFLSWGAFDRVTRHLERIDLLDRQALQGVGRAGLRGAVLWLVGSSIASFLAWGMPSKWPLFLIVGLLLGVATLSLLRPAQIVHRRLRSAKSEELERVREKIALAKEAALAGGADAAAQSALLPGLMAYEARIEAVREWPFDTPTLVRFALLALLAAGSWLGGALVERALGVVLD